MTRVRDWLQHVGCGYRGGCSVPEVNTPGLSDCARRLLSGLAATVLLGCGPATRSVDLICPTTGIPLWDEVHTGTVSGARSCGMEIHYDGPPREDDLRGQLALFTRSIHANRAGLILAPTEYQAFRSPVHQAISMGLNVVVLDADLGIRSDHLAYVMTDDRLGGEMAAEELAQLLHGHGTVVLTGLDVNRVSVLERDRSLEAVLAARYPQILVAARLSGAPDLVQEQETLAAQLGSTRPPDALIALSALSTRAAYFELARRPAAGRPHLIGFDQSLVEAVRRGEIDALVATRAHTLGQVAAATLCREIAGQGGISSPRVAPMLVTGQSLASRAVWSELDRSWWTQ